jgi:hypothetical protein
VASYLVEVIGQLWERAAFLLPFSLYQYYAPQDLLVEGTFRPGAAVVLGAVALAGIAAAAWRFTTRDIP